MREWHLLPDWSNQNPKEEEMAFENLVFVLKNYLSHGYKNVLVTDLKDERVGKLVDIFSKNETIVVSLVLNDDEELKRRVTGERDSGFKDFEAAIAWNTLIKERSNYKDEFKIDNTEPDTRKVIDKILALL